uniref:Uncharacterized protein n=1 Tax=Aegilops tauschii subsp. strangulata TaxID=200361 RepID=A0A453QMI3_AEGTS
GAIWRKQEQTKFNPIYIFHLYIQNQTLISLTHVGVATKLTPFRSSERFFSMISRGQLAQTCSTLAKTCQDKQQPTWLTRGPIELS